ncbi:MAG: flagellar biosynthesis anti-sigma factor FlgM [Thiobacillaceae bacterium]
MKIDQIQNNVVGLTQTDAAQRPAAKNQDEALNGAQDSISLSKLATHIRQVAHQLDAGNEVDLDRVNTIRQAIESGSYKISSERIASGMLNPIQPPVTKS